MTTASQLLAIPDSFRRTALALPDKVRQAVAVLDDPEELNEMLAQTDGMKAYTKHLRQSTEVNNSLQFARLEIESGLGRVMPSEQGKGGGRGQKKGGKTSLGTSEKFKKDTITQYRKVHRNDGKLGEYREKIDDHNASLADDSPDALQASTAGFLRYVGSDGNLATKHNNDVIEWYTPEKHIEAVRKAMGGIDLDPATSDAAQATVKAAEYYTQDTDGLARDWQGRVFMNPPFKMPLVAQFVTKLIESYQSGDVSQAILLTNNNTDTKWWQSAATVASVVCFTAGRISFYNPAGESSSPTNGQTFMYFGRRVVAFCKQFDDIGICLRL